MDPRPSSLSLSFDHYMRNARKEHVGIECPCFLEGREDPSTKTRVAFATQSKQAVVLITTTEVSSEESYTQLQFR